MKLGLGYLFWGGGNCAHFLKEHVQTCHAGMVLVLKFSYVPFLSVFACSSLILYVAVTEF